MLVRDPRLKVAFDLAQTFYGLQEIPGPDHQPQIQEFLKSTWYDEHDDETPWCSAFVNWCMETSRLPFTDSPRARSWLEWGEATRNPVLGDLVVLTRGTGNHQGHVGFFVTGGRGRIAVLGGNQDDRVSIEDYASDRVLGFRTIYVKLDANSSANNIT